ncbi:GNAT family N-acetyltransferase [Bacillus luteolus]|uniref:GNAT family N-acetyltransferase n=1 Tax=Litchfieldia luteola TaxID=682179 RepID=A0ABR9QM43_9BACI|nr:GNAT family protein [Cytobacillus luteolus]MBE4909557.1 GNAT family N-acetyltransferase [Cytobacillus luteolus]MBP1940958.1 RimJ/RimL family protein N-acetyltransferase [Cytobacillus luteolus]
MSILLMGEKVIVRVIKEEDFEPLWHLIYGKEDTEWRKWNAPYFPFEHEDFSVFRERMAKRIADGTDSMMLIQTLDREIIGTVSYYWEDKNTRWLEAGIVINNSQYWHGGYGTEALKLWIGHLFATLEIARVGITTWSGNERMMRVAEKLGLQLEGRMRKCRYYNGKYYDSIRMGVLREEWDDLHKGRSV